MQAYIYDIHSILQGLLLISSHPPTVDEAAFGCMILKEVFVRRI